MTSWTQEMEAATDGIYQAIIRLPFITRLADGTLEADTFRRYIAQDSLYINQYSKVLAHIASRLDRSDWTEAFLGFAADGVAVEKGLHSLYVAEAAEDMSPACLFYTSFLRSQALEPVEVEAAAVLPCFLIYLKVGLHIAATQSGGSANPYHDWIATYSDEAFSRSCDKVSEILNTMARTADPQLRTRMSNAYKEAARQEWLFWHSAYQNLKWPAELI